MNTTTFCLEKNVHQVWIHQVSKYYETSSIRNSYNGNGEREGVEDLKCWFIFSLTKYFFDCHQILFTIVEDGICSMFASFEEVWLKNWFLKKKTFSFNCKIWFYLLKNNRSQQPFKLEQEQGQIWRCLGFPNNLMMADF